MMEKLIAQAMFTILDIMNIQALNYCHANMEKNGELL